MAIESFIFSILLGSVAGIGAGLLPGVGATVTVLLLFPLLLSMDPMQIIVTFVSLYSMSQFVGSVPAIFFGIPGEASSVPAVLESNQLKKNNQLSEAIAYTGLGSLVGSVLCLLLIYVFSDLLDEIAKMYLTALQASLLFLAYLMILFFSNNRTWINLLLMGFGVFLASIGMHGDNTRQFLVLNTYMMEGLPIFPVLTSLLVFPIFFNELEQEQQGKKTVPQFEIRFKLIAQYFRYIASSLRGTVLGFFGGFCPGLTHAFSSQIAYGTESIIHKGPDKALQRVVSAESANNAGAFSAILPLLLLAIPISSSEALILSILKIKGYDIAIQDIVLLLEYTIVALVFVNILGILVSWPAAKLISKVFLVPGKILYSIIGVALLILNYYVGVMHWAEWYYMIVLVALAPIGYLLRRLDTAPVIFVFILYNHSYEIFNVARQLYFF